MNDGHSHGLPGCVGMNMTESDKIRMTFAQAKKLQERFDTDCFSLTREQCKALDRFVKDFALIKLKQKLRGNIFGVQLREFVYLMVRCHYGSMEVDELLCKLECYPDFVTPGSSHE